MTFIERQWAKLCAFLPGKLGLYVYGVTCCLMCRKRKSPPPEPELETKYRAKLLVLGLPRSGKSRLLTALSRSEASKEDAPLYQPTVGFRISKFNAPPFDVEAWEVGGDEKVRPYWPRYAAGVMGLVFMLDGNREEGLAALREFLANPSFQARYVWVVASTPDQSIIAEVSKMRFPPLRTRVLNLSWEDDSAMRGIASTIAKDLAP
jgi:hypothetical protein